MVMDLYYWALSRGIKIILCFLILKFKIFIWWQSNWSKPGCDFFLLQIDTSSLLYNAKSVHKVFELTIGSEDFLSHLKGKKRGVICICKLYLMAYFGMPMYQYVITWSALAKLHYWDNMHGLNLICTTIYIYHNLNSKILFRAGLLASGPVLRV